MPDAIEFTVYGHPAPQGSSRAFVPKGWTRPIITSTNPKLKPWRQEVTGEAMSLGVKCIEAHVPVKVRIEFYFERAKSATVKKRPGMTTKPDVDKLVRAILDSLKGVLIHDDSQVDCIIASKRYGTPERAEISVRENLP